MALFDSVAAYYALDEASGNALDSHTSSLHLTDTGSVAATTGKVNGCREFIPTDYFTRASSAEFQMGNIGFWLSGWAWIDLTSGSRCFVGKDAGGSGREYSVLYSGVTNRLRFLVTSDGSAVTQIDADTFGAVPTGEWVKFDAWHDPDADTIAIAVNNGTPDQAAFSAGVHVGTSAFTIGAQAGGSLPVDGRIDEVTLLKNYVPTAGDRAWMWNGGNGRSYADIVAAASVVRLSPFLAGF